MFNKTAIVIAFVAIGFSAALAQYESCGGYAELKSFKISGADSTDETFVFHVGKDYVLNVVFESERYVIVRPQASFSDDAYDTRPLSDFGLGSPLEPKQEHHLKYPVRFSKAEEGIKTMKFQISDIFHKQICVEFKGKVVA